MLWHCDTKVAEDTTPQPAKEKQSTVVKAGLVLEPKTNPFSLRNMRVAKQQLGANGSSITLRSENQFIYFKLDPNTIDRVLFQSLEADTTIRLLAFPFADGAVYGDNVALDDTKAGQLADGLLYGVTGLNNPIISRLKSNSQLRTVVLDTLYKPTDAEENLHLKALETAGFMTSGEVEQLRIRFCLFKRPRGTVRYQDNSLNRLEPVVNTQVWALAFGVPVSAYTNLAGQFEIPFWFSVGTIVGTHARNAHVNIKPLDTHGGLVQTIGQLIVNFVIGSVHIHGWVGACGMRDINIRYTAHRQNRYWAQLLNAVYYHDVYCAQADITRAPNGLVIYAQWADAGNGDFGGASAPMLGHISGIGTLAELVINDIFGGDVSLSSDFPNLFNLIMGVLPDLTFRVPQPFEPQLYSERLAQTAFHESGHASHFMRAGNTYWINVIRATLAGKNPSQNPYGDGNEPLAGFLAVAESWAQFIGFNFASRRYTTGRDFASNDDILNSGQLYGMNFLIENEFYFFEDSWIPYGLYHDLMDNTNAAPNNSLETWDRIQGVTLRQMYLAHGPNINSMCAYRGSFVGQNPALNQVNLGDIFNLYGIVCQ